MDHCTVETEVTALDAINKFVIMILEQIFNTLVSRRTDVRLVCEYRLANDGLPRANLDHVLTRQLEVFFLSRTPSR